VRLLVGSSTKETSQTTLIDSERNASDLYKLPAVRTVVINELLELRGNHLNTLASTKLAMERSY